MRDIAVVALARGAGLKAKLRILLPPTQQVVQHGAAINEHIAGIFKDCEAHVVLHERQRGGRKAEFQIVQEQRTPSQRKSCCGIARACLVQPEAAMRVATTHQKAFRERNNDGRSTGCLYWVRADLARLKDVGIPERVLDTNTNRTRKHKFLVRGPILAERVIGRILHQDAAEIRLRAEVT